MLTQSEIYAIKQSGEDFAEQCMEKVPPQVHSLVKSILVDAYGLGARTVLREERQRAKVLLDALEEIIKSWDSRGPEEEELKENKDYGFSSLVDSLAIANARTALNTYNKNKPND